MNMQSIQRNLQKNFTVERPANEYADLVALTAKLIGRSFIVTAKMMKKWDAGFALALYDDCMTKWRSRGFKSPAMMWWTERKKLLGKTTTT